MLKKGNQLKAIVLVVWMVLLTMLTMVFGSVPMRALRVALGRVPFLLLQLGLTVFFLGVGWKALAITLFVLSILVSVYRELELKGFDYFYSGLISVCAALGAVGMGFWIWTQSVVEPLTIIRGQAEEAMGQLEKAGFVLGTHLKVDELLFQVPSAVVVGLAFSLFLSLAFESKVFSWLGVAQVKQRLLIDFKVPDYMIWVFVISLAGSYIKMGNPGIQSFSLNVFNVTLMAFFLQGMAVIQYFLGAFKAGVFVKVLVAFMIFGQPFGMIALSFVGVVDYWVNFRRRLKNKMQLKLN